MINLIIAADTGYAQCTLVTKLILKKNTVQGQLHLALDNLSQLLCQIKPTSIIPIVLASSPPPLLHIQPSCNNDHVFAFKLTFTQKQHIYKADSISLKFHGIKTIRFVQTKKCTSGSCLLHTCTMSS